MVKGCPTIRVQRVQVGIAVSDDCIQRDSFLRLCRKHSLVDGSFPCDALPIIDSVTAVDEILQVLMITLVCRIVQILQHVS